MLWNKTYKFSDIDFNAKTVDGWYVRDADQLVMSYAYDKMQEEMPELRREDIEQFEFQVDWILREVVVTELEYIFAY